MANAAKSFDEAGGMTAPKHNGSVSLIAMLGVMVVAMSVVVGGVLFWLTRTGRLPAGGGARVQVEVKVDPPRMRMITLEPLLVNLADSGGAAYLRVAMVLRVEDPPPNKSAKPKAEEKPEKGKTVIDESEVMLRDAALDVIGRQSGDALVLPVGKEHLKDELRAAFKLRVPEVKVADVLFTEFLIQR